MSRIAADRFEHDSLLDALNHSIRNARHLRVRDSALVVAARKCAARIDEGSGQTDHVLFGTFLKQLEALGLVPEQAKAAAVKKPVKQVDELAKYRAAKSG